MKKITFLLFFLISSIIVVGQSRKAVLDEGKWDDPVTFKLNPPFIIKSGEHSDSLATVYKGYEFYLSNEEYFGVATLADYYLWFVNEFSWKFAEPELYEYYYLIRDNREMMRYIYGTEFKGNYYPIKNAIKFSYIRSTAARN